MISFALVERQSQLCLFEFLYRTYSQGMFQIAYGILHDVQHAEDMVAETYIRVAKNINRIAEIPADKHRSYLKMIIRNICIDYYRSIHPTDTVYEIPLDLSDNSSGPEDIIIDRITVEAMRKVEKKKIIPIFQQVVNLSEYSPAYSFLSHSTPLTFSSIFFIIREQTSCLQCRNAHTSSAQC